MQQIKSLSIKYYVFFICAITIISCLITQKAHADVYSGIGLSFQDYKANMAVTNVNGGSAKSNYSLFNPGITAKFGYNFNYQDELFTNLEYNFSYFLSNSSISQNDANGFNKVTISTPMKNNLSIQPGMFLHRHLKLFAIVGGNLLQVRTKSNTGGRLLGPSGKNSEYIYGMQFGLGLEALLLKNYSISVMAGYDEYFSSFDKDTKNRVSATTTDVVDTHSRAKLNGFQFGIFLNYYIKDFL